MPFFGKKKKKKLGGKDDGMSIELFHVAGLASGSSDTELYKLEKKMFGRSFQDLLQEGYQPSVAIKADDGGHWTARGKIG